MGAASSCEQCTAERGFCTGRWRRISTSRTLRKNVASEYDADELRLLRGREGGGRAITGESKKSTYIENVILRPSQISSFHNPRPASSENKRRVGYKPSQAIPPRFFARVGSAANNSSFPYIAKQKQIKKSTYLRSKEVGKVYVLRQSIRAVVGPWQESKGALKDAQRFFRLFADQRHANCKLLCSHVAERYAQNELKSYNIKRGDETPM